MAYIILVISFILDRFISNIISLDSLFYPLFSIISLIIIYPYFIKNEKRYFITISLFGLLYDIAFTNTLLLNMIVFFLLGALVYIIYEFLSINLLNTVLTSLLLIVLYRVIIYFYLVISNYLIYSSRELIKGIYSSLIINIIYSIFIYLITSLISKKYKIRKSK